MAKIRGYKPGLWTDEDFVELTPWARLLWMGMWTFACDNGHLPDKPKQIKMQALPADDVNCAELLRELAANGRITRADGWITIPNLTYHQKPDRRYFTACTKEGCEVPEQTVSQRKSRRVHGVHTSGARGVHATEGDGEVKVKVKVKENLSSDKSDQLDRFDEFWDAYGKKVKRADAEKKWAKALAKPGVTPDLLITAAREYVTWERMNNEGGRYIADPSTWLHGERWNDERVARQPAQHQGRAAQWLQLASDLGETPTNNIREIGPRA